MGALDDLETKYSARTVGRVELGRGDSLAVEYSGDASEIERFHEQVLVYLRATSNAETAPPELKPHLPVEPNTLRACLTLSRFVTGVHLAGQTEQPPPTFAEWLRLSHTTGDLVFRASTKVAELVFGSLVDEEAAKFEAEKNASRATADIET